MRNDIRTLCFDEDLQLEACCFQGITQPFPNHFHEYYVIGIVDGGQRQMTCRDREYTIQAGNVLAFQPGDNHGCRQIGGEPFSYRSFHIPQETVRLWTRKLGLEEEFLCFKDNVIEDRELAASIRRLHETVMGNGSREEKEEAMGSVFILLLEGYALLDKENTRRYREEVELVCRYMQNHLTEEISLKQMCRAVGLSKSTLMRKFGKSKGLTPYRYLESIRINEGKKLLKEGVFPAQAAACTGFYDQSHFTNFFRSFIGLAPGAYRNMVLEGREKKHRKDEKDRGEGRGGKQGNGTQRK